MKLKNLQKIIAIGSFAILSSIIMAPSALALSVTTAETIDTGNKVNHTDSVSDSSGNVYVVSATENGTGSDLINYYKYTNGVGWGGGYNITTTDTVFTYNDVPKIDVSPSGYIGIVWSDHTDQASVLKFAESRNGGSSFMIYTIDDSVAYVGHPDFKYKSDDTPLIAGVTSNGVDVIELTWTGTTYTDSLYPKSGASMNETNFFDLEMQLFADQIHLIGASSGEDSKYTVYYNKGTDTGSAITWTILDEAALGGIDKSEYLLPSINTDLNSSGEMRFVIIDDEVTTDTVYFGSRDGVGSWSTAAIFENSDSNMAELVPSVLYLNGTDYVMFNGMPDGNSVRLRSSTDSFDSMVSVGVIYAEETAGLYSHIISDGGTWSDPGTPDLSSGYVSITLAPLNSTDMMAILGVAGASQGSGQDEYVYPTCSGDSPDGDTYTASRHYYTYDGTDYGDGVAFSYSTEAISEEDIGAHFVTGPETANISCAIKDGGAGDDMNWHLALVTDSMGPYYTFYFNAEDYSGTEEEIIMAINTYLSSISYPDEVLTIDYLKLNALTFTGTAGVDGSYSTSPIGTSPVVGDYPDLAEATWTDAGDFEIPSVTITPGAGSGESVPEFKDYLLIVTIALALGLAYTVIPKTGAAKA